MIVRSRLTPEVLFHRFILDNKVLEDHSQYLISKQEYLELLSEAQFEVLHVQMLFGTLRTEFICKSVDKCVSKT